MIGMIVESIIVSFIIGGIIGAVTALHMQQGSESKRIPLRIPRDQDKSNR